MKISTILFAAACVGTASASVACNAACTKMPCFSVWCAAKNYRTTVEKWFTFVATEHAAAVTVTTTCKETVTVAGQGATVTAQGATVTVTATGAAPAAETVTVTATGAAGAPETTTVTINTCSSAGDDGGY
ncbi:hypothetical protein TWF694_000914 [Orbilia ellipsospora]|uniref:Uncharacterized protein n=1 Tax=Orbilia ellipsospora TaxID=2528407 RepID=A0AAV9XRI4_9PEZI